MAIYRPVHIQIWKDPDFEEYKPPMKLIFLYLITNESITESGIYPVTIKTISNETGIPKETVGKLLASGLKNVSYDHENQIVFVHNFLRYNGGGRPDLLQKSIEKNYRLIRTPLWTIFQEVYPQYVKIFETVGKQLANRSIDTPNTISISISKSNSKSNSIEDSSDLKTRSEPKPKVLFNHETLKWENITKEHTALWNKAYPACNLEIEFAKMKSWIIENPAKGHKSNWGKFIINWLSRAQDRGGTK